MEIAAWFHKRVRRPLLHRDPEQRRWRFSGWRMEGAVEVAKRMGLPLVATSDAHYVNREDAEAQDVLLCINTGKFRTDTQPDADGGRPVLPPQPGGNVRGVSRLRRGRARKARRSPTASTSSWNWASGTFPIYKLPPEKDRRRLSARAVPRGPEGALRRRARANASTASLSPAVMDRLERELAVINKLGFRQLLPDRLGLRALFAREQGIPATARGAGVGALVCLRACI